jgi:hypothetical protein
MKKCIKEKDLSKKHSGWRKIEEWADKYLRNTKKFRTWHKYVDPYWDEFGHIVVWLPVANNEWTFAAWQFVMQLCKRFSCYPVHIEGNGRTIRVNVNEELPVLERSSNRTAA